MSGKWFPIIGFCFIISACSSLSGDAPVVTPPEPTATTAQIATRPLPTDTVTPNPELVVEGTFTPEGSALEEARPLTVEIVKSGQEWNGMAFQDLGDGSYKVLIKGGEEPNLLAYTDGTIEIVGVGRMGYRSVQVVDGEIIIGLWKVENGQVSEVMTNAVPTSMKEINQWVGSIEIVGKPGSETFTETIKTLFVARDQAAKKMDVPAEFVGISVELNFKPFLMDESLPYRPSYWKITDWQNARRGKFLVEPISGNQEISYSGKSEVFRPLQVMIDPNNKGYFRFTWQGQEFVHVPVAVINTNGTTDVFSAIASMDKLEKKITILQSREERATIGLSLDRAPVGATNPAYFVDQMGMVFAGLVNVANMPPQNWPTGNDVRDAKKFTTPLPLDNLILSMARR